MDPLEIAHVLRGAIRARHAVTLSRGGRPVVAEPYDMGEQDGKLVVTYYNADAGRFEVHQVATVRDVVDLGGPLDALPTYSAGEASE